MAPRRPAFDFHQSHSCRREVQEMAALRTINGGRVPAPIVTVKGEPRMPIKDVLLPLVGEPEAAAIDAIDKCIAFAGDIGARVTAIAVEEDIAVRPRVMISVDLENAASAEAIRSVSDAQGLLK